MAAIVGSNKCCILQGVTGPPSWSAEIGWGAPLAHPPPAPPCPSPPTPSPRAPPWPSLASTGTAKALLASVLLPRLEQRLLSSHFVLGLVASHCRSCNASRLTVMSVCTNALNSVSQYLQLNRPLTAQSTGMDGTAVCQGGCQSTTDNKKS